MTTTVQKLGNSYGLILPKSVAEEIGALPGTKMTLKVVNKQLVFKIENKAAIKKTKKYDLLEMVRHITPKNRHEAIDWGYAVGNEIIDDDYSK